MKTLFLALTFLFFSSLSFAEVTESFVIKHCTQVSNIGEKIAQDRDAGMTWEKFVRVLQYQLNTGQLHPEQASAIVAIGNLVFNEHADVEAGMMFDAMYTECLEYNKQHQVEG